ncbi:MAG: hypothetical protein ACYTG2_15965 [Planctomycetota bacterium]|jgi:hypothetical protein
MSRDRLAFTVLLSALVAWCIACVTVLVQDRFAEFVDAAIYLLTAKSLAAGEGYTYLGSPFFVRPPGTSALIAPFIGTSWDHHRVNLVMQCIAVGSFAAVALAMSRLHGATVGVLIALLFALNRLTLNLYNAVLSELPFVLFFYLSAWLLMPDRQGRPPGWRRGLVGAVCLAVSCYMRSIGLLALPGLALMGLSGRTGPRWRGAALAALALALTLPWMVWSQRAAGEVEGPSTQLLMFDYSTALLHVDPGDPTSPLVGVDGYFTRIRRHSIGFGKAVAEVLTGSHAAPLPGLVLVLCLAAMFASWWTRRSLLDWFMLAYLALLFLYFTFADRLILPMIPLLISVLIHGLVLGLRALGQSRLTERVAVGLLVGGILVVSATHAERDLKPHPIKQINGVLDGEIARWLREETPPDTVVMHERGPILSVLSDRPAYSCRNLRGTWPDGFPEVDWIILTPGQFDFEPTVAAAALETREFPVRLGSQTFMHVMYRMRDPR